VTVHHTRSPLKKTHNNNNKQQQTTTERKMNLHKYTYRLGRSLYIPLTSKCNSIPLPVSRGPNFILGRDVVDVLLDFRRAGFVDDNHNVDGGAGGGAAAGAGGINNNEKRRTLRNDSDDDDRVSLPEYNLPLVTSLYPPTPYLSHQHNDDGDEKRKNEVTKEEDDLLEPSIDSLVEEVKSHLHVDDCALHEVCIAGEGEVSLYTRVCCKRCVSVCNKMDCFWFRSTTETLYALLFVFFFLH